MKEETKAIIKRLENQYKDDPEAIETIERAKADIEYTEKKEAAGGYTGQPSIGKAIELEAFLHDWH